MTVHEIHRNRPNTSFNRPARRSSSSTSIEGKKTNSMKAIPPTPITAALRWTHCANVAITFSLSDGLIFCPWGPVEAAHPEVQDEDDNRARRQEQGPATPVMLRDPFVPDVPENRPFYDCVSTN